MGSSAASLSHAGRYPFLYFVTSFMSAANHLHSYPGQALTLVLFIGMNIEGMLETFLFTLWDWYGRSFYFWSIMVIGSFCLKGFTIPATRNILKE